MERSIHPASPASGSYPHRRYSTATRFKDVKEETPILENALLDQLGDMWAADEKKGFPTFLTYLNYQVYGMELEHARERRARKQEEKAFRSRKALSAARRHGES